MSPEFQPLFMLANDPERAWPALSGLQTPLSLPCTGNSEASATLSHFSVDPTLSPGVYQGAETLPEITLSLRDRRFAPMTTTLTFSETLAPLSLWLPGQSPVEFSHGGAVELPLYSLSSGATLPLSLRWQARQWMAGPLVIVLKLLDKDFTVVGERLATLGDRYPNVLWAPGEVVEESYILPLVPDAPPGLYRLEISLIRQDQTLPEGYEYLPLAQAGVPAGDHLYPLTVRLLDPAHSTPPSHPFSAELGPKIHLAGYALQSQLSGSPATVELALYWESTGRVEADYTVFTQLVGPDGQVWAQWDNPPQQGRYPTSAWSEHDTVVDRYTLTLGEDAPPGEYRLMVGMYDPATGQRLPAAIAGTPQPDNALLLTTLMVAPE
jgi:hypothetical protein